ncbi:MAG: dihydrofolate reductase [Bacteroidota bacterium]
MRYKQHFKWAIPVMIATTQLISTGCNNNASATHAPTDSVAAPVVNDGYDPNFEVAAQSFGDLQVLRYQVPGFQGLTLKQKQLAYYLYEAALCGRDIIYDQKSKHGLLLRKTLETVYGTYKGDKNAPGWKQFEEYCGRFWFSNGNHHHYSNAKFIPGCGFDYFARLVQQSDTAALPREQGETTDAFLARIQPIVYDMSFEPKVVDLRPNIDNVKNSSNNFYEGVTQKEVEAYYAKFDTKGNAPAWGLNSKVMKENGQVVEKTWRSGGMYGAALDRIIKWLQKASLVAENDVQRRSIDLLINYYQTGDLKIWDEYNIAWVSDTSRIDAVNGFIEVYLDAIGKKGSFESTVSLKDMEETKRIKAIADQAQWFEDNSPISPEHKKKKVTGITGKAITVIVESGDAAPSTPIGINLPNAEWIRKDHGSKSVSLTNIVHSYNIAGAKSGMVDEFAVNDAVMQRMKKHGALASDLHTDMHECIGHASGQINEGVETTDKTLKNYASCLEEARADLVGLYFIMDKKLLDLKVMPDMEVAKAGYDNFMMNGLMTQLTRLQPGEQLEEAHMRNRALIAHWAYEKGLKDSVVTYVKKNGKTYVQVNDYNKLRDLFGQLLKEIQRIKSEGDYKAGRNLVENYGVKVDPVLHKEILERFARLNIKPYRGFIQPKLSPVMSGNNMTDIRIEYPTNFYEQMMEYGKDYSFLQVKN